MAVTVSAVIVAGIPDLSPVDAKPRRKSVDTQLTGPHQQTNTQKMRQMLRSDGIRKPHALLRHNFLVRLEISNAGGGSAAYSEVMLYFDGIPKAAIGKAWADDNRLNRAQIGNAKSCKIGGPYPSRGHTCPKKYNTQNWVNLTTDVNRENKVLIINDPDVANRAGTIIWFAFDTPQKNISYKVIEKRSHPSFGFGKISARKYKLGKALHTPHATPHATPHVTPPVKPRVIPPGTKWDGNLDGTHQDTPRRQLRQMLMGEGLPTPRQLLVYPYLVRVEISNTGGGSASHSEVLLKFTNPPIVAIGKAWADNDQPNRAQIGNFKNCEINASLAPHGHTCPNKYNGQGWVDLTSSVSQTKRILIINDPNIANRAGTVIWFAFNQPQNQIQYDIIERKRRHQSFGFGNISARKYKVGKKGKPRGHRRPRR